MPLTRQEELRRLVESFSPEHNGTYTRVFDFYPSGAFSGLEQYSELLSAMTGMEITRDEKGSPVLAAEKDPALKGISLMVGDKKSKASPTQEVTLRIPAEPFLNYAARLECKMASRLPPGCEELWREAQAAAKRSPANPPAR
jgi:hypothetical protein